MTSENPAIDPTKIFDLLESSNPEVVQEIKTIINDNFNTTKENWLVGGLYDHYVQTGSSRTADILCCISREPHDKFLIDKIDEGLKSPNKDVRKQSLNFLCHVACKQPSWLYKITTHSLFKNLIRLLKTESDVVILQIGLLNLTMIVPLIPIYITSHLSDIFDVFGRLATFCSNGSSPKELLLHLQVGLYSLFHRLYAMWPCNFLSYLRHHFGERSVVFYHTVLPMLEKVKMHPLLVTGTKERELSPNRWKSKEYHDVIAECSKISLDVLESSLPEEGYCSHEDPLTEKILNLPMSSLISKAMNSEVKSLQQNIEEIPITPKLDAVKDVDPLKERKFNSANSIQLFGKTPPPTPTTSVPSSPLPTDVRRDSIFDSGMRRDSIMYQRLQKVAGEQEDAAAVAIEADDEVEELMSEPFDNRAQKLSRLRFHSQCTDARPKLKRSNSCPDITQPDICKFIQIPNEHLASPSPHNLLDLCISKAASLHKKEDLGVLVELLHAQLLFERHRRDAHALRNRRLALKCKKVQAVEESNMSMRREISALEKEISMLKKEGGLQRSIGLAKESDLSNIINDMEIKFERTMKEVEELKDDRSKLDSKLSKLQEEFLMLQKESSNQLTTQKTMENELSHCKRKLGQNTQYKAAYYQSQREILLLGELLRRQQETTEDKYLPEQMEELRLTFEEEVRNLRNQLESKSSQVEAIIGYVKDLEKSLEKKENVVFEIKKEMMEQVGECEARIKAIEEKYESIKAINSRLEYEILSLQHQLSEQNRPRQRASPTNGEMSPASNHSDVDSAASAGGMQMSPDRFIFGSPQFQIDMTVGDIGDIIDEK